MNNSIIFFIIIFVLVILYFNTNSNKSEYFINYDDNKAVIPLRLYPELNIIGKHREVILYEVKNLINKKVWILFKKLQEDKLFSKEYTRKQFNELNRKKYMFLNTTEKPEWCVFSLIYNGMPLDDANKYCPQTMKVLNKIPYILAAGISCLESNGYISPHKDEGIDRYRYHYPLIIPENCGIKINNKDYIFDRPFIFDDTYTHSVWNFGKTPRFVLIIDIERK